VQASYSQPGADFFIIETFIARLVLLQILKSARAFIFVPQLKLCEKIINVSTVFFPARSAVKIILCL
jgi:hypothetical protein